MHVSYGLTPKSGRRSQSGAYEAGKKVLDPVALLAELPIVTVGFPAPAPGWDAGHDPLLCNGFAEPVGIVTFVDQQDLGGRQAAKQRRRTIGITHLDR